MASFTLRAAYRLWVVTISGQGGVGALGPPAGL